MFSFFKRKKVNKTEEKRKIEEVHDDREEEKRKDTINTGVGISTTNTAKVEIDKAEKTFAKPDKYTGNRNLYDSGNAKQKVKTNSFKNGQEVRDRYTGELLELRIADAKMKYGDEWQKHLAEGDHITPIEKIFNDNNKNPWLSNNDIKEIANSNENLETVSREFNNSKRSRTNEEFVTDDDYLKKTGVEISEEGKQKAIDIGQKSQDAINKKVISTSIKNIVKTGHQAGMHSAENSGITAATMSGIMNITAVIRGEKSIEDALADTTSDTCKSAATGYVMGGGLTTISHSLSSSSSKFLKALSEYNVPGNIITAVIITGNTLKRYGNGEISTQECIIELGEKGLNLATTSYTMAIGQAMIPIPIVGAAIGALVGSVATSKYYHELVNTLQTKELEHQERERIISECEIAIKEARNFRLELESYLESYFNDYKDCFDEALSEIRFAFKAGNADGIIAGSNQITRKLGGNVYYETIDEFKEFLDDDSIDLL